ncbi:hypothetical protein D3C80_1441550 [compost metagenome]
MVYDSYRNGTMQELLAKYILCIAGLTALLGHKVFYGLQQMVKYLKNWTGIFGWVVLRINLI